MGLVQESADGKEEPSFSECALKLTKKDRDKQPWSPRTHL